MSPSPLDTVLRWESAGVGATHSAPVALDPWTGERLEITVASEQAALVIDDGEVRAVLLEGAHAACVLLQGEEPGDLGDREWAARLDVEPDDVRHLRRRLRTLRPTDEVVFVSLGVRAAVGFGENGPTAFLDRAHGSLDLELEGACHLSVSDPVRFYESFLRNAADLDDDAFDRIAAALIEGAVVRVLAEAFDDVDDLARDPEHVAATAAAHLRPSLAHVGLGVEQLELTRLETPLGLGPAPVRVGGRPLVSSERHG